MSPRTVERPRLLTLAALIVWTACSHAGPPADAARTGLSLSAPSASKNAESNDCVRTSLLPAAPPRPCVHLNDDDVSGIAELLGLEDRREFDARRIAELLGHPTPEVRSRAALAAGRLRNAAATPLLLAALDDTEATVRADAAFAIGLLGDSASTVIAHLAEVAANADETVETRLEAIAALGRIGGRDALAALDQILDEVAAHPRDVSREALLNLWRFPRDERIAQRLTSSSASDDAELRWRAVYALARGGYTSVDATLRERLADPDSRVRAHAARALGAELAARAADELPAIADALAAALDDPDAQVRINALRSLARGAGQSIAESVIGRLEDEDVNVRIAAAETLGAIGGPVAANALDPVTVDTRGPVALRGTALAALVRADLRRGLTRAEQVTREGDWLARLYVARALDGADTAAGGDLLRRLSADDDARVAAVSKQILARLEGRPAPTGEERQVAETSRCAEFYEEVVRRYIVPELAGAPRPRVRLRTTAGDFTVELAGADAPLTTHNFLSLAAAGFYDGNRWHRVVPNFVLQAGDPRGDGGGGPGYAIRDEINRIRYTRGTVGMALSGPDTGGSQFFVTHSPQPHLDGGYTVFGRVVAGMSAADRVVQDDIIIAIENEADSS